MAKRIKLLAGIICTLLVIPMASSVQAQEKEVGLQDTVVTALEYSPRLKVLQNNEQAIAHERDRAFGGYLPRADLTVGYGAESHSDVFTRAEGTDHNFYDRMEARLQLSQLIYDGSETASRVGIEEAKLNSANYRTYDNAEAIALDAIIAHMEVLRQRELVGLAKKNVDDHLEILSKLKDRQEAGAGSIANVDQTESRLARSQAALAETQSDLRTAEANYLMLVGKLPGVVAPYDTPKELIPSSLEEAVEATRQNNPKIMALGANVTEAEQRVELSKSSFLPKLNAELSSSYEDQVESLETYEQNNQAMLRMRWNLFNGGSDIADRKAAAARKMQAISARNDQRDLVIEETMATWAQLQAARQRVVAYGDAVGYSQKTLDSYLKQFNVGQRTLLDVLDARNELFQNSGLLVTARINEVVAIQRLLALAGRLNQSLGVERSLYMVSLEK